MLVSAGGQTYLAWRNRRVRIRDHRALVALGYRSVTPMPVSAAQRVGPDHRHPGGAPVGRPKQSTAQSRWPSADQCGRRGARALGGGGGLRKAPVRRLVRSRDWTEPAPNPQAARTEGS
ncbi:hypothetical protein [Salinispora arenicola]|uniref:hypothetical protein n=1 Tax=Salinispora arenicola TaxID=168697 RepID=UPI0036F1E80A